MTQETKFGQWLSVDERLPTDGIPVLVFAQDFGVTAVMYCYDSYWAADDISGGEGFTAAGSEITHWMPLPQPPAEGGAV